MSSSRIRHFSGVASHLVRCVVGEDASRFLPQTQKWRLRALSVWGAPRLTPRESKWAANPRFFFTSSVTSAQGWNKSGEGAQFDAGVAAGPGHGASKNVSEWVRPCVIVDHDPVYDCSRHEQILVIGGLPAVRQGRSDHGERPAGCVVDHD